MCIRDSEGHLPPGTNFLEKPFTESELLRRVRSVLGGARVR